MSPIRTARPYAAKAIVEHWFYPPTIQIYVTFRFPMNQTVKPAHNLWECKVAGAIKAVVFSVWDDAYTLRLIVAGIATLPSRVTLEYSGPDKNLKTTWDKQWEPWGPIISIEIPTSSKTLTFSTGPAQQDDVDITTIIALFLDCSGNAITISGFTGGVDGQILNVARLCATGNNATLMHAAGASVQDILLHAGADETLTGEYGGWVLVCDGSNWFDCSHSKHV